MPPVPLNRRLCELVSWIACFAILLAALAPALSHAVQRDVPAGWIEICSVTGAKLVRIDDGAPSPSESGQQPTHADTHCPYCALHVDALGLPPSAPATVNLWALSFHVPELFLLAPRPLFAWASAQPRAPPLNT